MADVTKKLQLVGSIWGALLRLKSTKTGQYLRVSGVNEKGEVTALEAVEVDVDTPVFDLAAMGMGAVPLSGGYSRLQTDTAAIRAALEKGPVGFVIPFSMGSSTINATIVMNSARLNNMHQCISVVNYLGPGAVELLVDSANVTVTCASISEYAGIPIPTADDKDKIIQANEDGTYSLVAVKDSSVATFLNEYMEEALGGVY
jgi:hypothetical protein